MLRQHTLLSQPHNRSTTTAAASSKHPSCCSIHQQSRQRQQRLLVPCRPLSRSPGRSSHASTPVVAAAVAGGAEEAASPSPPPPTTDAATAAGTEEDGVSAVSTVDALLSVMSDEEEDSSSSSSMTSSSQDEQQRQQLVNAPSAAVGLRSTGEEEEDAAAASAAAAFVPSDDEAAALGSTSTLGRYGSVQLPAAPELEAFLAAAAAADEAGHAGGDDGSSSSSSSGFVSLPRLQALFPFQLDDFQAQAVQVLLNGRSVVVCAPTGAGKTAIAEAAAAATLARGQRVIYTTPLKALSNQKLLEAAARFGSSRCGLQTGDTSLNTDADIVVMTTEILRNIMYRTAEVVGVGKAGGSTRDERLGDVGLVVLDEVHYLGDPWRGSVWEEAIINCPRHIQILAMSATVQNPEELGGWINEVHGSCETVKTQFRPVPLQWGFAHKAPRRGALLEDLLLQQQQQQQPAAAAAGGGGSSSSNKQKQQQQQGGQKQAGSSSSGSGSGLASIQINPGLKMDLWIHQELKSMAAQEAHMAREFAAMQQQQQQRGGAGAGGRHSSKNKYGSSSSSSGSSFDDFGGYTNTNISSNGDSMWGLPPLNDSSSSSGVSGRSPQQIWSSLSARDKRDMTRRVMARRTPTQAQVIRVLQQRNMLPAIWFIMSRRDCDLSAIAAAADVELVSPDEAAALNDELQRLFDDSPEGVRDKLVPAFLRGIASHHAGCLPAWKALVERCFQKGLLKLVFATGTLAAGINMPARTTVISSLARRTDEGIQLLPHNELLQMAGRAGRRGYDTQGHCVVVQGRFEGAEAAHSIIAAGPEPLQSQFTTSYSLVLNLLSVYSLDQAREFLSKTFGTYLTQQQHRGRRAEAEQLMAAAAALTAAAATPKAADDNTSQQAALAAVKREKAALQSLYKKALADHAALAAQLLALPPAAAAAAAAAPDPLAAAVQALSHLSHQQQQQHQQEEGDVLLSAAAAAAGGGDGQQQQQQLQLPQLVLLNLVKNPVEDSKQQQQHGQQQQQQYYLPALAVQQVDSLPLNPGSSTRDKPQPPFLLCLGGDNQPLAVSVQHVVGVYGDADSLQGLLGQYQEQLGRLDSLLTKHMGSQRVWTSLRKMMSAQVTFGSTLTSSLAAAINVPLESFTLFGVSGGVAAGIEQQAAAVAAAKRTLKQLQQQEAAAGGGGAGPSYAAAVAAAANGGVGASISGGGGTGGAGSESESDVVTQSAGGGVMSESVLKTLMKLKGRDRLNAARRLVKRARKLLAETQDEDQINTWTSFMDVLNILVELGAMEQDTLRILPLGLVARGINCNNELWMAAAVTHPDVMNLTPPQLAAFVGALQCTDLLKRPMSIWSSFQVSEPVVAVIEELEPIRQAIFEAQTAYGQTRWNEHLAVDLRLAGLVEAWAGGASWQEVMADTSLDDGDMARLLARTADMLKQLTFLEDQLPYLIPTAREALRGMDRKPISDLVA